MTARKRKDREEEWIVDFVFTHADGRKERIRRRSPVQNRRGAEAYERRLLEELLQGKPEEEKPRKEVPKFKSFAKEFLATYAETNNKPSEVESKRMILKVHLLPTFGRLRLDEINQRQIETYKSCKTKALSPKTVNNHLTVLRKLLAVAVEWGELEHLPLVKWLKVPEPEFDFLSFTEADQLVEAAEPEWRPMILIGLKTGLRLGELLALRWQDVDLKKGYLVVRRAVARGVVGTPKSGRSREVPLSKSALKALKTHRHLKGELVFCDEQGEMLTRGECKWPLWNACDAAKLRLKDGVCHRIGWHVLRHSFASHLVMRGIPIRTVQELLGHQDIRMTMRYSHLSPDARREAVQVLDQEEERSSSLHGRGTNEAPRNAETKPQIKSSS